MFKSNYSAVIFVAVAWVATGCESNDPSGYFAPIPANATGASVGAPITVSPSSAPVAPPAPVNPGGSSSGGSGSSCTPQAAQNLRVMFMVDASGSTQSDDSGAKVRTGAALSFINANLSNTNLSYSYGYFAANEPTYDFSSKGFSNSASEPFGSGSQAVTAVDLFQSTYMSIQLNGTDYQDALSALGSLVTGDNAANPGKYSYAVIFMSDGQPNRGADTSSAIDALVANLVKVVGSSRLTLSSVYFSNSPDTSDEGIIDNMAIAGNGQYVNGDSANLNLNTMIQGILTVPSGACSN
jgi:hypothetical protein